MGQPFTLVQEDVIWRSVGTRLHDGSTNNQQNRQKELWVCQTPSLPFSLPKYLLGISSCICKANVRRIVILSEYIMEKIHKFFFPKQKLLCIWNLPSSSANEGEISRLLYSSLVRRSVSWQPPCSWKCHHHCLQAGTGRSSVAKDCLTQSKAKKT